MPIRLRHSAIGLLLAVGLWSTAVAAAEPAAPKSLSATLDAHLTAINARDLDGLLATVTRGDKLTLILPNGQVLETREQFRQLHVDWFAEQDWRMRFQTYSVRELGDVGVALVKYESQTRQPDGAYLTRREAWLSLVFAKESDGWRLVYDQNTVIPPTTP
ncbi:SgcJ/EcaC family oxidoreductase [Lysobacter sp. Root983]|uniref:YybH family protein n=1 Tax=Lysobacter sp. Root983 TaxID=1736613 RepID=UPI00070BF8CA|nr:SgcJ/EcaC family oxidoreductase [Lysobacter sp. Root983]KRD75808.1 hypothetical protein ASE43_13295 [Lysobacter sp. Root983]